jgi:para-aminobenzoate synthetase/4-amino-4-deoxychorismate lyase
MKFVDILNFVKENENSAFFYTPNIYKSGKSFLLKRPTKILTAKTKEEVEKVLLQADEYSLDPNIIGFATIPYEVGYYFQKKRIANLHKIKTELRFLFFNKKDVIIIDSDKLDFINIEKYFNHPLEFQNQKLDITKEEYIRKIDIIKNYIANGDTYQINFTTKTKFDFKGNIVSLFIQGIFNQSAKYSAFINFTNEYVLSFSPELFFETDYNFVSSCPMKGTLKRKDSFGKEKIIIKEFLKDKKNLAENVMIVDLLRNDIGKISEINSVKVNKLFNLEKYETLFQLTSTVTGKLINNKLSNTIKNLFPCGSITGAPKIRSMEIISELEKSNRGIYTGAIGIIQDHKAVFNIPIRTMIINKSSNKGELGLGSGIVWDSNAENEYKEVLLKGEFINPEQNYFELLETFLFEDGNYFLLNYHLKRLEESAKFFLFNFNKKLLNNELSKIANQLLKEKKYKIRILLNKWGNIKTDISEINEIKNRIKVRLSNSIRSKKEKYLYHKTNYRPWDKEYVKAQQTGFDEVLFVNKNNQILEGAITNIIVKQSGIYYTPPLNLGILNGCYRQFLLDEKKIEEKILTVRDLKNADEIILCNSIRKEMIISEFDFNYKRIAK